MKRVQGTRARRPRLFVDREKICPFLLRVFLSKGKHHPPGAFGRGKEPVGSEFQIYTWRDATLGELARLVRNVHKGARLSPRLSFELISPDRRGNMVARAVGIVGASSQTSESRRSLDELRFITGDYLDVAMLDSKCV